MTTTIRIDGIEWITPREYAKSSGHPLRTVQYWAAHGRVEGASKDMTGTWLAPRAAWEACQSRKWGKRGPRKKGEQAP